MSGLQRREPSRMSRLPSRLEEDDPDKSVSPSLRVPKRNHLASSILHTSSRLPLRLILPRERRYVGRRISKKFSGKIFSGTVSKYAHSQRWWVIEYDDGDAEEMDWDELATALALHEKENPEKAAEEPPSGAKDADMTGDDAPPAEAEEEAKPPQPEEEEAEPPQPEEEAAEPTRAEKEEPASPPAKKDETKPSSAKKPSSTKKDKTKPPAAEKEETTPPTTESKETEPPSDKVDNKKKVEEAAAKPAKFSRLDCQENDFGGWPEAETGELPVDHLTEENRVAIVERCSNKDDPALPNVPEAGPILSTAGDRGDGGPPAVTPQSGQATKEEEVSTDEGMPPEEGRGTEEIDSSDSKKERGRLSQKRKHVNCAQDAVRAEPAPSQQKKQKAAPRSTEDDLGPRSAIHQQDANRAPPNEHPPADQGGSDNGEGAHTARNCWVQDICAIANRQQSCHDAELQEQARAKKDLEEQNRAHLQEIKSLRNQVLEQAKTNGDLQEKDRARAQEFERLRDCVREQAKAKKHLKEKGREIKRLHSELEDALARIQTLTSSEAKLREKLNKIMEFHKNLE